MLDTAESAQFPVNFRLGTSTIAYEIEGRGGEGGDGKGFSMWDEFSHFHPKNIADRTTASTACDSYHKFQEDVFMLKSINANSYNFTLSWSRILPEGTTRYVNWKGVNYYDSLINTLLENGIDPIVTLTDQDLPLALLQKYAGGWMNKNLILAFESYAKFCFAKFGDRVRQWITVSQPWDQAWNSYAVGIQPPNLSLGYKGAYLALTNLLKAHAVVYRLYEKRFKQRLSGRVGISLSCKSSDDKSVSQQLGRVMDPLVFGRYPRNVTDCSEAHKSCCCSALIREDWVPVFKGAFDFVALHFSPELNVKVESCKITRQPEEETLSPFTVQNVLSTMKTEYGNPEVLVFCIGPALALSSQMMDIDRAQYFNQIARNILEATENNQCNVKGYFPGKLMDCWEWESGFTISHGLFHVEFSNPNKKRSPRASVVFVLKHLFKEKKIQPDLF